MPHSRSCTTLLKGAKQVEEQNNVAGLQKNVHLLQDSGPRPGAGVDEMSEVTPSSFNPYWAHVLLVRAFNTIHPLELFKYQHLQAKCKCTWCGD